MNTRKNSGFTLIELMIVVAIIAIIASIAIPKMMSARISANENAAIATLRSIASAQAQLQSSSAIDTDADGGGEYGYFGELAGSAQLRSFAPATPTAPTVLGGLLVPSILPTPFSNIRVVSSEGIVTRSGYNFKIYLPGATVSATGVIPGIAETGAAGVGGAVAGAGVPDSDNCEILWAAYAWPEVRSSTGTRTFFINQEGDLLQYLNNAGGDLYDGDTSPAFAAAYSNATALSMGTGLGLSVQGLTSGDAEVWTVVGN
jgi:prepilin-type N-terminal cleavage/methylation domain-containing protein